MDFNHILVYLLLPNKYDYPKKRYHQGIDRNLQTVKPVWLFSRAEKSEAVLHVYHIINKYQAIDGNALRDPWEFQSVSLQTYHTADGNGRHDRSNSW